MMSPLIGPFLALNAIATLVVGGVAYCAGKRLQNSIWLVYNILFSIWSFCLYKAAGAADDVMAAYWLRGSLVALVFMVPVFLHFLSNYADRDIFRKKALAAIYAVFFLISVEFFLMPKEIIKGVVPDPLFGYTIIPGLPLHIFTAIFAGYVLCGFFYLLNTKKLSRACTRNQRLWLFWGMLLGMLAPAQFFLRAYGIPVFPFGVFCVIPYLCIVAYIIVKYHVCEIDIVVNKTVLLAYTALFVILAHFVIVYILNRVIDMEYFEASVISGCVILLNLLFTIHYAGVLRIKRIAHRVVYEQKIDYYRFLEEFNAIVEKAKDLSTILSYAVDSLISLIGVERAFLYLLNEENSVFELKVYRGVTRKKAKEISTLPYIGSLVDFLIEGNIFVADESKDFIKEHNLEAARASFDLIGAKLVIPLYYSSAIYEHRDVVGFLNLGEKKGDASYSREDIDILNAFGRQLGICLDNAKLYSRAIEDDLTRLYRVEYFRGRIDEEIKRSARYKQPFALLMLDIDDFKNINDHYGHQVGDEVLRRLARLIRATLRGTDVAARYGGEEFGILLPETDATGGRVVGERLRQKIEEEFGNVDTMRPVLRRGIKKGAPDVDRFRMTISVGVSSFTPGMEREELIREADRALYKAKQEGKNRVC